MTEKRTVIIRDTPSEHDEFHGEGHRRSAMALADAVEQLGGRDGAIGLEGSWGAGKSTVIRIAEQHFSDPKQSDKKRHIFTFDLWLHQPELLKLAFLEEFIAWSGAKKFVSDQEAAKYLERITDREITTRIENKREFSGYGIFFILLAPLLPIVYAWLSPLVFAQNSQAQRALLSAWGFEVSGVTLALSVLTALYVVFALAAIGKLWARDVSGFKAALSAAARFFSRETDHDKIKQSIREKNPTNEEFQSFFREILSVVQKKGDRVVFVFDNIDRLPSETVLKVWSETRSIFSMRSRGKQPADSNVVAIVPYDAKYVSEVFKEGNDDTRGEHLIRKTFDITIRVAPPLSTDWRKFLEAKLDVAFPEKLSVDDKYKIFKLFDIDHQERIAYPTPRNIIVYVNDIASVWNQWGDKIPVAHIALYVLHRRRIEANPTSIKSPTIIGPRYPRVIGSEDWHRSLVALIFNVDPEHAYQILLGQEIDKYATGPDPEPFVKLSTENGFAEVFPDYVQSRVEQWARDGGDVLARLARNMADERVEGGHFRETWHHIGEAFTHLSGGNTDTPEAYADLSLAIKMLPAREAKKCAERLIEWFSAALPKVEERIAATGSNWLKFFAKVHDGLEQAAGEEAASELVQLTALPSGSAFALGVCGEAAAHTSIVYDDFMDIGSADDLRTAALTLVKEDPELLLKVLRYPPWFVNDAFRPKLSGQICDRVQSEQLDELTLSRLIELLSNVRSLPDVKEIGKARIQAQAQDGSLVWHAMRAKANGDLATFGRIVWLIVDATDGEHPPSNPGNHPHFGDINSAHQGYLAHVASLTSESKEVEEIARLVSESKKFSDWLGYASAKKRETVFTSAVRTLVSKFPIRALRTKDIAQNFSDLEVVLGADLVPAFLAKFAGWKNNFAASFTGKDSLQIAPSLLSAIARHKVEGLNGLSEAVDAYFDTFTEDQWSDVLSGKDVSGMEHLLVRIETGSYRPRVGVFQPALMQHTLEMLDGQRVAPGFHDRWAHLFDGLQKNTRGKFALDLLINLGRITTTTNSVEHFLATCGPLAREMPFKERADVSLDQIVVPLISSASASSLDFIRDKASEFAACAKSGSDDVVGRVDEALLALRQSGEDGETRAKEIATLIGRRLPAKALEDQSVASNE